MNFTLSIVLFVATFLFTSFLMRLFFPLIPTKEPLDFSNKAGLPLLFGISIGWIIALLVMPFNLWQENGFVFGLYPFAISALTLSFYCIQKGRFSRFAFYLLITSLSVFFLPQNAYVFQGIFTLPIDRFLTALLWAGFISLYGKMDKAQHLTMLQSQFLCFGFIGFALLTPKISSVSYLFTCYPALILAAILAYQKTKKKVPHISLGKTGAIPLGYLMGLFFILLAQKGFYLAALVMPAYYYFEAIYSSFVKIRSHYAHQPTVLTFYITRVMQEKMNHKKIIPALMSIMAFLMALALVVGNDLKMALLAMLIIFAYLFNKLSRIDQPKIRIRDVWHDTKEATAILFGNQKDSSPK